METNVTYLSGILLTAKARVAIAALALGVAGLGLPAEQADARRNDNGVRCAMEQENGHIDFYLPGHSFTVGRIRTTCNQYGEWVSTYMGPRGR